MGRPRSGAVYDNYRKDKAAYKLEIRAKKREDKQVYTNELHEALLRKQGTAFWKCWGSKFNAGRCTVSHVNGITDPTEIVNNFARYFEKVCTGNTISGADRLRKEYEAMRKRYCGKCISAREVDIDAELVESVIRKMKRGKAPGLDGITAEHLQFCHYMLPCILAKLFNLIIQSSCVLTDLGKSYTVPILKASNGYGKSLTVEDFRGVSISPVISKVLEHCILDRYEFLFETCDNQFGFKKRLGCRDAVYTFRCVVDYYVSCESTVNVGAVDLSKAFDKMNHHGSFIKLMERRIPDNLLRFLENWFSLGVTCVKWESFTSDFFVLSSGIRQGGVLSPYLFAVYIDSVIMKVAASNVGCHIKWICINILIYADDILLLAPSISALQELIHVCQNELEWLDMLAERMRCRKLIKTARNET